MRRNEKRMLHNCQLRGAAIAAGLSVGTDIIIRERSILKDGGYITRMIRRGTVRELYSYHFSCCMADGTLESFRYNELLGDEARLIQIKGKRIEMGRKASERMLLFLNSA